MQISKFRTQNVTFVCSVHGTSKQNHLRKSQVIFIASRGRKTAR